MSIEFRSTNNASETVSFKQALLRGQAPDYGLYMPMSIPRLRKEDIAGFRKMGYHQIAFEILRSFIGDEIEEEALKRLCKESYNFDVPLEKVMDHLYIMRLDRGPTASFKDFAARLMARLMDYFAKRESKTLTVLVATSGDTGGAVADAFYGFENINVTVLFPEKEVTDRQRRQMTTLGKNVRAIAVRGTFDDCQAIVKRAFNDNQLDELHLTSANSINFGRLLPQIVYYVYAYSRVSEKDITFSVPCGNFGNLMGGVFAREMGIPIRKFVVGVNENDEFPLFLKSGIYVPIVPSRNCSSNAMNVGHPSNLARLIDMYGGWLTDERNEKGEVTEKGVLKRKPDMQKLRNDFISYGISDSEVNETIKEAYDEHGIILEPHGAVAYAALQKAQIDGVKVALETADPAKFPEQIEAVLGIEPKVPKALAKLDGKEEYFVIIDNDYSKFKKTVLQ